MALTLARALRERRTIDLGGGVEMDVKAIGYAEWKAAEARAFRLAQDRLEDAGSTALASVLAGEDGAEYRDRISGLAAEILLDALVQEAGLGWRGVADEAGEPLPLTRETWAMFRRQFPWHADRALAGIQNPALAVEREGNGSGRSSSGT